MGVIDGRTWLEHLPDDECWAMLAAAAVGRVGLVIDGAPEIFPVNFAVDGRTIVFRTDPGSKLRSLDRMPLVCFEVDDIDMAASGGASVLVKGTAHELVTADERAAAQALPLEFWAHGDKDHWIRIDPTEVTGRRIFRPG